MVHVARQRTFDRRHRLWRQLFRLATQCRQPQQLCAECIGRTQRGIPIHPQGELSLGRGLDPKRLRSCTAQDVELGVAYAVPLESKFGDLERAPPTVLVGTSGLWIVVHR
jgi:hypothetical protein